VFFLQTVTKKTADLAHQRNSSVLHSVGTLNDLWYRSLVEIIRLPLW